MANVLSVIPKIYDENLLVGLDTSDDAAVYKLNENQAIINTLDFFPPMVDDPYIYGKIAAANALSDIYAMGGKPLIAMNIVCFPSCQDMGMLREILRGGYEKVAESGALLVGGHTVDDKEPKYGLSVTGIVHPNNVKANCDCKIGDVLVLTKPIGVGVFNMALKANLLTEHQYNQGVMAMEQLNKYAAESFENIEVNGVTDVTGFGLLGHAMEMVKPAELTAIIDSKSVPIIDGMVEFANMGIIPSGMYKNIDYVSPNVQMGENVDRAIKDLLYDPVTSGGLLISVPKDKVSKLIQSLKEKGTMAHSVIGEIVEKREKYIEVI